MQNPSQQLIAATFKQKQIAEEHALMKILGTNSGFFKYYFDMLPKFKSQTQCFNAVNLLYYKLWGEYRYSDYNSFRKQMTNYLKSKK